MASERLGTFQTNEGDVIYKERNTSGEIQYRRGVTGSSGKQGGSFVSPDLGRNLEKAARSSTDESQTQPNQAQIITPTSERDRDEIIGQKYLNYKDTENRNKRRFSADMNTRETAIRSWMDNEQLKQQIDNDPLLETESERRQAQEALAIEIVDELGSSESERERRAILRQYNLAS